MIQRWLCALVLLWLGSIARADVSISLPLGGYYRTGRYMPVQILAHDASHIRIKLSGPGIMPTECSPSAGPVVLPLLMIRPSGSIQWSASAEGEHVLSNPLRALNDDECLIGYVGADAAALQSFFPDKKMIGIALDLSQPLAGPAAAWEALDGLVLDAQAAARITQGQLDQLLTSGMAVAIRSPVRPAGAWPWRKSGEYWLLRFPISGPTTAFVEAGYLPVADWSRGWPVGLRHEVMLASLLFIIVVLGASLWKSRWGIALVVLLCVCCVGVVFIWRARQPTALERGGAIMISNPIGTQVDRWAYYATLRSASQTVAWQGLSHPILATRTQIEQMPVRLVCAENGEPQNFEISLETGRTLALMERSISQAHRELTTSSHVNSPMRLLAQELYLRPGDAITGQLVDAEPPDRWATVRLTIGAQ